MAPTQEHIRVCAGRLVGEIVARIFPAAERRRETHALIHQQEVTVTTVPDRAHTTQSWLNHESYGLRLLGDHCSKFTARTVEIQTYAGSRERHLVRADLDIEVPIEIFPFEIRALGERLVWRSAFRRYLIITQRPVCDLDEARIALQCWAAIEIDASVGKTD